jgi:hypothetical protein
MKKLWLKSLACSALLSLAACGSGPSDDDIGQAIAAAMEQAGGGKTEKAPIKDSKCSKSGDDAWECDFLLENAARHGRFSKLGGGWKLVGQLG